jgi:predicted transposase YbfD/YdcC
MCKVKGRKIVRNGTHLSRYDAVAKRITTEERCTMHSTTLPFTLQLPADLPFAFSLHALMEQFATLTDQRTPRGVRYPLPSLLAIAVLAKLAGANRVEAVADWARLRAPDLARLFGLSRTTMPHSRTWGRIFAQAIDPLSLESLLSQFFQRLQQTVEVPARGSIVLTVDGKTLRGTIPAGHTQGVHLVAAYCPDTGLVLAQVAVEQKTNEIVAVPQLMTQLDLQGMVVTGDAMQAQRALSTQIVEAGGDYLWFIKENQPTVYEDIERLFGPEVIGPACAAIPTDFTSARSVDNEHGRLEERVVTVSSWLNEYTDWPYLEQVFKLERTVTDRLGRTTQEVRYGITSLPHQWAGAARVLQVARAEWGIENGLHYRRDVSLQEDASRIRRGHAPQVLAALNNIVVSLAAYHHELNLAKVQREFQYHLDRALAQLALQPHGTG